MCYTPTCIHACQYLHVRTCTMVIKEMFFNQQNTQHTDIYGRVRMHVYMHLAFKELINEQIRFAFTEII